MNIEQSYSIWEISDSDEPGTTALVAMRYREYTGVMVVLVPTGDAGDPDWYGTGRSATERPSRPVLVFYRGERPPDNHVLSQLESGEIRPIVTLPPLPDTFYDFEHPFAERTIENPLTCPPFPWLDEAVLGMEMAKYFNMVEVIDWDNPSGNEPGFYTLRFFRSKEHAPIAEVPEDSFPF